MDGSDVAKVVASGAHKLLMEAGEQKVRTELLFGQWNAGELASAPAATIKNSLFAPVE